MSNPKIRCGKSQKEISEILNQENPRGIEIQEFKRVSPLSLDFFRGHRWYCLYQTSDLLLIEKKQKLLQKSFPRSPQTPPSPPIAPQELTSLQRKISDLNQRLASFEKSPSLIAGPLQQVQLFMQLNDFSQTITDDLITYLKEMRLSEIENPLQIEQTVLVWILNQISFSSKIKMGGNKLIFVGPPGVGKTTTIAKIAARYIFHEELQKKEKSRLVSISLDNVRIAAETQSKLFAETLKLPFYWPQDASSLKEVFESNQETDLFLIDTFGHNPKKEQNRSKELNSLLTVCDSNRQIVLTLSATSKLRDLRSVLAAFSPIEIHSILLTKLDETETLGNALSLLIESKLPLSFMTIGQEVPDDIREAGIGEIVDRLIGLNLSEKELKNFKKRYSENLKGV